MAAPLPVSPLPAAPAKILLVAGYYLPGYKAGGPIRSNANLVEFMGAEFDFRVVAYDRDLGDQQAYAGQPLKRWLPQGRAQVCYLPPAAQTWGAWRAFLAEAEYDALYLGSFLEPLCLKTLWLQRLGLVPAKPLIVAPRGEFSAGALALKKTKKRLYLTLAKFSHLGRRVVWHASTAHEAADIQRALAPSILPAAIQVATDFAHVSPPPGPRPPKQAGQLRVVFFSRIARMKNLLAGLEALAGVTGAVEADIYGPLEDPAYWADCEKLIRQLPAHIRVVYRGLLAHEAVPSTLAQYHLFFLPTLGEAFGHAIIEALGAGCPALISDQTPWKDLAAAGAGWALSLSDPAQFTRQIQACVELEAGAWEWHARQARCYAEAVAIEQNQQSRGAHRRLFDAARRRPASNG